jgi:hypothetical protein
MAKKKNNNVIWAIVIIIALIVVFKYGDTFMGAAEGLPEGYGLTRDIPATMNPTDTPTITFTGSFQTNTTDIILLEDIIGGACRFNSTQSTIRDYKLSYTSPVKTDILSSDVIATSNDVYCDVTTVYQIASSTVTQMDPAKKKNLPSITIKIKANLNLTVPVCTEGAVQDCNTTDSKLGNQSCSANAWGSCVAYGCNQVCGNWSSWTDNKRTRTCTGNVSSSCKLETKTATCSWYKSVDSTDKTQCVNNYLVIGGLALLVVIIGYFGYKNKKVRKALGL